MHFLELLEETKEKNTRLDQIVSQSGFEPSTF
jgi:hypothetical protein